MLVNEIISALLQIIVFTLIPFLFFLARKNKETGFMEYIGFVKTTRKAVYLSIATSLLFLSGALVLVIFNEGIREIMIRPPSITGKLREMGLQPSSLLILIIISCFKTSLAEEILFRGFIAKRLFSWLGYLWGNILQSFIFALVHLILFWALTKADLAFLLFIFVFSGVAGYVIGYIKEKVGNGSIIPGWIAHGIGNTLSYFIIAFVI